MYSNPSDHALIPLLAQVNAKAREFDKADALAAEQQRRMLQGLMAQV